MANGATDGEDAIQIHATQNVSRNFAKSSNFYAGQTVRPRRSGKIEFTEMSGQYATLHQGIQRRQYTLLLSQHSSESAILFRFRWPPGKDWLSAWRVFRVNWDWNSPTTRRFCSYRRTCSTWKLNSTPTERSWMSKCITNAKSNNPATSWSTAWWRATLPILPRNWKVRF